MSTGLINQSINQLNQREAWAGLAGFSVANPGLFCMLNPDWRKFSMDAQADIGLIGLAVMGQNLVLNMNDHGFTVAVFNRTVAKVDDFLNGPAKGTKVIGTHTLEEFIKQLKRPRRVMLMVKAGEPVDEF